MFNSIRTKLTLWYSGVLTLVIIAFALTTYFLLVRALQEDTDRHLREMAENFRVAANSEQSDEDEKPSPERTIAEAMNELRFQDYKFAVFSFDDNLIAATLDSGLLADFKTSAAILHQNQTSPPLYAVLSNAEGKQRIYFMPLAVGANHYRLFVFHSLWEKYILEKRLQNVFFAAVPLTILLAGFFGYWLAKKSLAPIVEMSKKAAAISANNLHERLPVKNGRDELGKLARVFNELLARLETSFEQQRRFMADASHELRTPLAIVRGEAEVALQKTGREPEEYRQSLEIVEEEGKRLTRIVEDLFTLARADAGQYTLRQADFYLDEVIAECLRAVRTLAAKRHLQLDLATTEEMLFRGDEVLIRRLIMNLLDNAIKYSVPNEKIRVSCRIAAKNYEITVANTGSEIASDAQDKIFDRFYRADKARSRTENDEIGTGAGLGLSISRWIAEAHYGKLVLARSDKMETVFQLILPRP